MVLSPRTWGWTFSPRSRRWAPTVVPTHVGVDLCSAPSAARPRSCPHARGGGPWAVHEALYGPMLSPRTWGWTAVQLASADGAAVVPTHVGVDPRRECTRSKRSGCPHARGGGPRQALFVVGSPSLSPRTWGWTADDDHRPEGGAVVPTHVGVDRVGAIQRRDAAGCPHARGGGPRSPSAWEAWYWLCPRTWGWTLARTQVLSQQVGLPTHVGVDRSACLARASGACCPHARGGGPTSGLDTRSKNALSPRTWRWTAV